MSLRGNHFYQFAGIQGVGDPGQIGTNPGIDAVDLGLLDAGQTIFDPDLCLDAGKGLQGRAESFAALLCSPGKGLDPAMFQGEKRHDPVAVAVIEC